MEKYVIYIFRIIENLIAQNKKGVVGFITAILVGIPIIITYNFIAERARLSMPDFNWTAKEYFLAYGVNMVAALLIYFLHYRHPKIWIIGLYLTLLLHSLYSFFWGINLEDIGSGRANSTTTSTVVGIIIFLLFCYIYYKIYKNRLNLKFGFRKTMQILVIVHFVVFVWPTHSTEPTIAPPPNLIDSIEFLICTISTLIIFISTYAVVSILTMQNEQLINNEQDTHQHIEGSLNYCTMCGHKLESAQKFCSNCGTSIRHLQ